MRSNIRLSFLTTLVVLAASSALAQQGDAIQATTPATGEHAASPEEGTSERAREGTRIVNQLGKFKTTGDRLTFQPHGTELQVLGLENLALERIGKVLADRRDQADELQWEITGVYTEYRGANYLLVTHAVLKTKANRSSPVLSSSAH
jgi:hypothetical protein